MPDPIEAIYAKIRQKKTADPAGFAAKLAAARQAAAGDTEFNSMLDEVDALPPWQEAPVGAQLQSVGKQTVLGLGAGITAIPAGIEALGRKVVAGTARAFGATGALADLDTADTAEASHGPLGAYLSSLTEIKRQGEAQASYDQPTGVKGFGLRGVEGLIRSAPILAGGVAGAAGRVAGGIGESAAFTAGQAGLMGAQTAQQALTEAAAQNPTAPIPVREQVNAAAQGAIGTVAGRALAGAGWLSAFRPERAAVPIGQALATNVAVMAGQGEAGALAGAAIREGRLPTAAEQGEAIGQGAVAGLVFGGVHVTAEAFSGRGPRAKVDLTDPNAVMQDAVGTPEDARGAAILAADDARQAEAAAADQQRLVRQARFMDTEGETRTDLTPYDETATPATTSVGTPVMGLKGDIPIPETPDASRPGTQADARSEAAGPEGQASGGVRVRNPAQDRVEAPARAEGQVAEHPALEGTHELLAKGRRLAVEVDEDHAQIIGKQAAELDSVDSEGAYVRDAGGELVHIPGEAITGVHDMTDLLAQAKRVPTKEAPTDAGRTGRAGADRPPAVAPRAEEPVEPRPAPAKQPAPAAPAVVPVLEPRGVSPRESADVRPVEPKPVAVENVAKAEPKPAPSEGFVIRTPGGKGKAEGEVVKQVGHNHFVVRTRDNKFIVAGVDRGTVARARQRGVAVPLQPADPDIGRIPNPIKKEAHSGRLPAKYGTFEEARAAAEKASNAYKEPEDVLGAERKAKAGEGPTGGRTAERPLAEVVGEKAPAGATKAERTVAKRKVVEEGQPSASEQAKTAAEDENVKKAVDRIHRAKAQLEEAPPRLADVNKAVEEAKKEFHEGLEPTSLMHAWGKLLFGERTLKAVGLTPDASPEQLRQGLSSLITAITNTEAKVARQIRVENLRASMPDTTPIQHADHSELSPEARGAAIEDLAKSLGLKLTVHDSPIVVGGREVGGFHDADTGEAVIGQPKSLLGGTRAVAHEVMHDIFSKLSAKEQRAILDLVAESIGDPVVHAEGVAKRWGDLLPEGESIDSEMQEVLADAGADALLSNHNNILGELPADIGSKVVRALHRIGNAIVRMLRRMGGIDGLKGSERTALKDIAERLLRTRIEKVRAEGERRQTLNEHAAEFIRATAVAEEAPVVVDPKSGDLHEKVLNLASKGLRTGEGATEAQRLSISPWADIPHVARAFPQFDAVVRGIDAADAAHHLRLSQIEEDVAGPLKHFGSKPAAAKKLYDLRLADIERREQGLPGFTRAQGVAWLRSRGLNDLDVQHAQTLWSAAHALRDAHMDALARLLGLKRAFSSAQTAAMIQQFQGLPKAAQVAGMGEMLDAWHQTVTDFENSTSDVYIPLVRLPADDTIIGSNVAGAKDNKIREPVSRAKRDKRMAELRAQHPGAEFTSEPAKAEHEPSPSVDRLLDRVREAAARTKLTPAQLDPLIETIRPAMLSHLLEAGRLRARGVEGYETDLGRAMAFFVKGANRGVRQLDTLARTRESLAALDDPQRPRLAEFARDAVATGADDGPVGRMIRSGVAVRALSNLSTALQNIVTGFTGPFMAAHAMGKLVGPVANSMTKMMRLMAAVPSNAKEAFGLALARPHGGSPIVEAAAERIGGTTGEALRRALRETDALKDPPHTTLDAPLSSRVGAGLATIGRAMMAAFTVTDRMQRVATFATAHQTAEKFSAKDWAHVEKKVGYHGAQDPYDFAVWVTHYTQGRYTARYRPPMFRSGVGATAYQMAGWSKQMSQNIFDMTRGMVKGDRKLVSIGALAGLSGLGILLHGVKNGVPFYGQLASDTTDVANKLGGGREMDQMIEDSIVEADKAGDHGTAFMLRLLRGGMFDAAAGATEPGSGVHRTAAGLQAAAAATAPRGLLLSTLSGRLASGRGTPLVRAYQDIGSGLGDIAGGIKAGNGEAIARGLTSLVGGPVSGTFKATETAMGKGVVQPLTSDGKPARTAAPSAGWEDVMLQMAGIEPAESSRLRELQRDLAEQHTLQQASLDTRIYGMVDAMRTGDPETVATANKSFSDYVQGQAKRFRETKNPGEKARLFAELGWMMGPNPVAAMQARMKQAMLNRKFGLDVPLQNPDFFMRQESADAAGR